MTSIFSEPDVVVVVTPVAKVLAPSVKLVSEKEIV